MKVLDPCECVPTIKVVGARTADDAAQAVRMAIQFASEHKEGAVCTDRMGVWVKTNKTYITATVAYPE